MRKDPKKDQEEAYLRGMLDALSWPYDSVERSEAPDFYVEGSRLRVGIELTAYHTEETGPGGQLRRAVEQDWERLMVAIRETRPKELENIAGHILFEDLEVPGPKEREQFVEQLISFVSNQLDEMTKEDMCFEEFPEEFPLLSTYVGTLHFERSIAICDWGSNIHGGWVGVDEDDLLRTVEEKCLHDRPKVDEFWLEVYTGWRISQTTGWIFVQRLAEYGRLAAKLEASKFDRVFIYDYMDNRVLAWKRESGWLVAVAGRLD